MTFTVYIRLILRKIRTFFLLLRSFFMGVFPPPQCKFLIILVEFYLEKLSRNSQELTVCPLENGHLPGFFERKIPPQMSYVILGGPFSCQLCVFPQKVWMLKKFKKPCKFNNTNLIRHCVGISYVQTMWFKDRQLQYLLQGLIINYAWIQACTRECNRLFM